MRYLTPRSFRSEQIGKDQYLTIMKYLLYGSAILYFGRSLLIPLSFALLISFILYPVCGWLERKKIGRSTAIFISILLLLLLSSTIFLLLAHQFTLFLNEWPAIQAKTSDLVNSLTESLINYYSITEAQQEKWIQELAGRAVNFVVNSVPMAIRASISSSASMLLIPIFAALILYYRRRLAEVAFQLFPSERKEDLKNILSLSIDAYYSFIKGMAVVYLIVGVLNSIGLLIIGVPHAILFGFIASVLTFIPYLGVMVGSLLPMTMAWLTFNSVWPALGVVLVFAIVQYLEANVIFPLAVSNRLNINTLATLIAIIAGGIIWGVSGMILFIPFVGIVKLISDQHPKMKIWSLMIGK
jgi:predicted PurR-regulated permease PerM